MEQIGRLQRGLPAIAGSPLFLIFNKQYFLQTRPAVVIAVPARVRIDEGSRMIDIHKLYRRPHTIKKSIPKPNISQ